MTHQYIPSQIVAPLVQQVLHTRDILVHRRGVRHRAALRTSLTLSYADRRRVALRGFDFVKKATKFLAFLESWENRASSLNVQSLLRPCHIKCSPNRARHWCLPHCPGQVEFVNYSCGAGENCILLAPLGKYVLYISGLLLRICASFVVCHPSLS